MSIRHDGETNVTVSGDVTMNGDNTIDPHSWKGSTENNRNSRLEISCGQNSFCIHCHLFCFMHDKFLKTSSQKNILYLASRHTWLAQTKHTLIQCPKSPKWTVMKMHRKVKTHSVTNRIRFPIRSYLDWMFGKKWNSPTAVFLLIIYCKRFRRSLENLIATLR